MLSLPVQLFQDILDELEINNLCSVARVCRAFREEPQRRSYHTIVIHRGPEQATVILQWILDSPRLASFVSELDITFLDGVMAWVKRSTCDYFPAFFKLLSDVLQSVTNLHYLRIRGAKDYFSRLQLDRYPFRLHTFILNDKVAELEPLLAFLTQEDSLRRLEFRDYRDPMLADYPTRPGFLPNLTTFSGNLTDASLLSRNRPIRHIYASDGSPEPWNHRISDISQLAGGSTIECLGFDEKLDISSLTSLPSIFPQLSILILFIHNAQELDALCEIVLPQLNGLRTLEIRTFIPSPLKNESTRNSFGNRAYRARPSLKDLAFRKMDEPALTSRWRWSHQHERFETYCESWKIDDTVWRSALQEIVRMSR